MIKYKLWLICYEVTTYHGVSTTLHSKLVDFLTEREADQAYAAVNIVDAEPLKIKAIKLY